MTGFTKDDLEDALGAFKKLTLSSIYKVRIGKIISFDSSKQQASIELVIKPFKELPTKEVIELETIILHEVRLAYCIGNFGFITTPIEAGNFVSVYFTDRDSVDWFLTGETRRASSTRMHDINSCFFIPFAPLPNNKIISDYDNNSITIKKTGGGTVKVNNTAVSLEHQGGGKVEIDSKINIANTSKDLKTTLITLAEGLKNTKVLNPLTGNFDLPIDAGTIAIIETFKADILTLLK